MNIGTKYKNKYNYMTGLENAVHFKYVIFKIKIITWPNKISNPFIGDPIYA